MLDGSEHDIHHSFTNAGMSQFDNDAGLDKAQDSYNVSKEMGYSKKEYEQILTEAENYDYSDYDEGWHSSTPTATPEPDHQSWFQASEDNDESEEHLTDNDSDGYYDFDSDSDSESL